MLKLKKRCRQLHGHVKSLPTSSLAVNLRSRPTTSLVPLLSTKHLDNLPPRVLRFQLRLARFDNMIHHVPGKLLYMAYTLSRASLSDTGDSSTEVEVEAFIGAVTSTLPATAPRIDAYHRARQKMEHATYSRSHRKLTHYPCMCMTVYIAMH